MSNRSRRHRQKLTIIDCKDFKFYISKNKFLLYNFKYESSEIKSFKSMFYVNKINLNKIRAEYIWNNRFILTDYNNRTLNKIFRTYLYNGNTFILEKLSQFIDDIIIFKIRNKEYIFCNGKTRIENFNDSRS